MFTKTNQKVRKSIYGILCQSKIGKNQTNLGNGTAFMIAPGICVTAAHVLHIENNKSKPVHEKIEIIRSTDIGQAMNKAELIVEDLIRDVAFIKIDMPSSKDSLCLHEKKLQSGTSIGSLGFPLAKPNVVNNQLSFNLIERFQGAYISAFQTQEFQKDIKLDFYESDSLMYQGSSGCPGFTHDGIVFGMHVAAITENNNTSNSGRLAISLWVPSMDIISFAKKNGVKVVHSKSVPVSVPARQ